MGGSIIKAIQIFLILGANRWHHLMMLSNELMCGSRNHSHFVPSASLYIFVLGVRIRISLGVLPNTYNCGLRIRLECRERFSCHRGLEIPTCVTARAWRVCRDACLDRWLAVSCLSRGWGKRSRYSQGMRNPQFYVSGKRLKNITNTFAAVCWSNFQLDNVPSCDKITLILLSIAGRFVWMSMI